MALLGIAFRPDRKPEWSMIAADENGYRSSTTCVGARYLNDPLTRRSHHAGHTRKSTVALFYVIARPSE
jgi:hypothetical protein